METETIHRGRVHQGRNIKRTRIEKSINQGTLSEKVHMSQPTVSRYESMKVIDTEILQRFARALDVPIEYLETLEEDAQTVVFESITNNDHAAANASIGYANADTIEDKRVNNVSPSDKITELYERLLKEKDDKLATLEGRIHELEEKYENK